MTEYITLKIEDAKHLLDLATDSPLIGSGRFDTDDVNVLRALAVALGVDPTLVTPHEFAKDYPHAFVPFPVFAEPILVNLKYGYRHETVDEQNERMAKERADPGCAVGRYQRRCNRPYDHEIHTQGTQA